MLMKHSLVALSFVGLLGASCFESACAADCSGDVAACAEIYAPVCGSDGKTYSSECELNFAKCFKPSLKRVSNDECPSGSSGDAGSGSGGSSDVVPASVPSSSSSSSRSSADVVAPAVDTNKSDGVNARAASVSNVVAVGVVGVVYSLFIVG